jgi:hypothetical protein
MKNKWNIYNKHDKYIPGWSSGFSSNGESSTNFSSNSRGPEIKSSSSDPYPTE